MFFYGGNDYASFQGSDYAVRLVRGGQYSLLSVTKAGGGGGAVSSNLPGIDFQTIGYKPSPLGGNVFSTCPSSRTRA